MYAICVIVSVIILVIYSKAENFQEIRVIVPTVSLNEVFPRYVLIENQDLYINLANDKNNIIADSDVRCYILKGKTFVPVYIANSNYSLNSTSNLFYTKLQIPADKITAEASTQWLCQLTNDKEELQVQFDIVVKGANIPEIRIIIPNDYSEATEIEEFVVLEKRPLHVILAMEEKSFSLPKTSISCFKQKDMTPIIIANVTSDFHYTTRLFSTRLHFSADAITPDGGTEWRCGYKVNEKDPETKYVRFGIRVTGANGIIVRINNIIATLNKSNTMDIYEYKYAIGEMITVNCETREKEGNDLIIFSYDVKTNASRVQDFINGTYVSTLLGTKDLDGGGLLCHSVHKPNVNSIIKFVAKNVIGNVNVDKSSLTLMIGCVSVLLVIIVASLCMYCWCTRIRNLSESTKRLNEISNHQFDNPIPPFPSQWQEADNYDYTYIENEYNYIANNDEVSVDNPLYQRDARNYAVPHKRITACSGETEKHYAEIDDNFHNQHKNKPVPYESTMINKNEASTFNNPYEVWQCEAKSLPIENNIKTNSNLPKDFNNTNYHNMPKVNNPNNSKHINGISNADYANTPNELTNIKKGITNLSYSNSPKELADINNYSNMPNEPCNNLKQIGK